MRDENSSPRFLFTGNAVGVGGGQLFPVQNASSLPMIGGLSSSSSGPFPARGEEALSEVLSYSSSSTLAKGVFGRQEKTARTSVVASVSEIRLAGDVRITALRSELRTTHSVEEGLEAELPIRTRLEIAGLSVKGYPVEVVYNRELSEMMLQKQFLKAVGDEAIAGLIKQVDGSEIRDEVRIPIRYSLVKRLKWSAKRPPRRVVEIIGPNIIDVKGVGYFHFGEVYRTGQSCRMSACRAYLIGSESRQSEVEDISLPATFDREEKSEIVQDSGALESMTEESPAMLVESKEDVDVTLAEVQSNGSPGKFPPPP